VELVTALIEISLSAACEEVIESLISKFLFVFDENDMPLLRKGVSVVPDDARGILVETVVESVSTRILVERAEDVAAGSVSAVESDVQKVDVSMLCDVTSLVSDRNVVSVMGIVVCVVLDEEVICVDIEVVSVSW